MSPPSLPSLSRLLLAVAMAAALGGPPSPPHPSVDGWPLRPPPVVMARFDPPALAWSAGHRGVDLLGAADATVRAPRPGMVRFVGSIAGRGVVVIDHGTERTTYEPVTGSLPVGAPVSTGTSIGRLQAHPASHCAPQLCLHWGRIRNADDVYLDPLEPVGWLPIRLLPLGPAGSAPAHAPATHPLSEPGIAPTAGTTGATTRKSGEGPTSMSPPAPASGPWMRLLIGPT